LKLPN